MISASPLAICCRPRATARRPLPHNWLMPEGGLLLRNAGLHRRLTGRVLALAGGQDLPEDDLVDVARLDLRAQRAPRLDRRRAEFMGGRIGEGAVERSDRRALWRSTMTISCCRHGVLLDEAFAGDDPRADAFTRRRVRQPSERGRHWPLISKLSAMRQAPGFRSRRRMRHFALERCLPQCEKALFLRCTKRPIVEFGPPGQCSGGDPMCHVERSSADHDQEIREPPPLQYRHPAPT